MAYYLLISTCEPVAVPAPAVAAVSAEQAPAASPPRPPSSSAPPVSECACDEIIFSPLEQARRKQNLSLLVLGLGIPCPIDSSQLLLFLLQLRRGLHGGRGQGGRFCSGWCGCGGRVGRRNARIPDTSVVLRRFSLRKNASLHFITSKLTEYFGSKRLQYIFFEYHI